MKARIGYLYIDKETNRLYRIYKKSGQGVRLIGVTCGDDRWVGMNLFLSQFKAYNP
jgi:hypothetical protein